MERTHLRITEILKRIICLVIVFVMLAGNFISPVKSFAEEINNTANLTVTEENTNKEENAEGTEEGEEATEEDTTSEEDTQAKIEEIEAAFEANQVKEQANNSNANEEAEENQEPTEQQAAPAQTRGLKKSAPALRGANTQASQTASNKIEDRITPDKKGEVTVKTKNDAYEINTFNTEFVSGATKDGNGNLVWTPTSSASGHEFTFRVNFALSGLKELPAEAVKITIPKQILRDREGNFADRYIISLPTSEEYDGETDLAYIENDDYIIVYNPEEVNAGINGYFEISYVTRSSTVNYKDYNLSKTATITNGGTASDPFNAVITVKTTVNNGEDILVNVSDDKNVFINTTAKLISTQKCYPTIYREWDSSWMEEEPEDKDDYYYLVWEIKTCIDDVTQKYNFTLNDIITDLTEGTTGEDYQFVGYKLSGEKYYSNKNSNENQSRSNYRYDYVLTRHKKATYEDRKYTLKNKIVARVDPVDQLDDSTYATSSNTFFWDPSFEPPTGSFYLFKFGNNNWSEKFGLYWDYANYDLDKLQNNEVNELKGFKYYTETKGYAYPWTLKEGGSSENPEDYGYNSVNYETWDDTLYLEDDTAPMTKDDYYLEYLTYSIENKDVQLDDFYNRFNQINPTYTDNETLVFYGKFNDGQDWVQIGTYNLETRQITKNDEYVSEITGSKVIFKTDVNCTGWRLTTTNKHYYTNIVVYPYFVLKNSNYVMEKIAGKDSIKIKNKLDMKVTDYKNETLFEEETSAVDYARVTYYTSQISKNVTSSSNNVAKRVYNISWKVNAWERTTSGSGQSEYIRQESGKFYDLIPSGGELDVESIQVQTENGFLPENEYTYEVISNYNNSGRTMLILDIKCQAQYYTVYYKTVHSWNSMIDYGRRVLNPVAYETGNETITKGSPDNGGNLSDENKAIFTDLDNTTNATKFIYAERSHNINALTAGVAGLNKKVKSAKESVYSYDTEIEPNGSYTYQLRFQNTYFNKAKDLVFYDSLENFKVVNSTEGTTLESAWKGTLTSVDLTQLINKGINPVLYVSTQDNLDLESHKDLTDTSIWKKATILTNLTNVKAIAIDMTKDADGSEFILDPGDSLTAVLHMKAPSEVSEEAERNPYTYNNIYLNNTLIDDLEGNKENFIHQDYTRVKYHVVADVPVIKVNEDDITQGIKGIKFRLYGTSIYGKEIDEYVTSDIEGNVVFKDIEAGEYILQEYEGTEDWFEDHTEHRVTITNKGKVYVDDEVVTALILPKITNKARIHADVKFTKRNIATKMPIEGVKFKISGISNYGNEILMYRESKKNGSLIFDNLEYGTYELKEIKSAEGFIADENIYRVIIDENGNYDVQVLNKESEAYESIYNKGSYDIYNEPFHEVVFMKKDEYSGENISGATFKLYGVSNYGNNYNEESTTTSTGFIGFTDLESGTYILQETNAPETTDNQGNTISYILDETKYIVTIEKDGKFNIEGVEKNEYGYYVLYNKRNKGQITITKKWVDESNNDERTEPVIHISNEKPEKTESFAYFRDNTVAVIRVPVQTPSGFYYRNVETPAGALYYVKSDFTNGISSFSRNVTLNENQVKELGAVRIDKDYADENAKYKIYAWMEGSRCYWWSNADAAKITDSSNKLFYKLQNATTIDLAGIDTSELTSMESMFQSCNSLTELDVSNFDTSNVTNMSYMFEGCDKLTELDVSNFDTSNVTNMKEMFRSCRGLTELDVSNFDTSNVTNMGNMFSSCSSLTELDLSGLNTSNVTNMSYMFSSCSSLTELDLSGLNTSNVTNMSYMFLSCSSLTELDVSSFNTSNVTNMSNMFDSCSSLTELDVSNFDTSNAIDMRSMFSRCSRLTELDLSGFNTSKVTNMSYMFSWCSILTGLDLSDFNTSSVTNMSYMFQLCSSLTELDLSGFDTNNVTNMSYMFNGCSNLKTIYASESFVTSKVTSSNDMFNNCTSIVGGNSTTYTSSYRTKTYARIDKPGQPGYFTEKTISSGSTNNMLNNIQTASTSNNIKDMLGLNNISTEITKVTINKPIRLLAPETDGGNEANDGASETLTYSTAETNYDDKGNEVHWVKNGDTWTYTFYVDDPYATWYVWEDDMNGYNTNYDIYNPGTVENQTATVINYTPEKENEVTIEFGNLSISKTLILRGQSGNTTITPNEDNTEFTFTVKLTAQTGKESTISGTKVFGDYVFKDGIATVKLHAGETVTINGLPAGVTYRVTEKEINGYETFAGANGTIVKDETSAVEAVNYKDEAEDDPTPGEEEHFVSFTVAKKVTGNGEVDESYSMEIALDNLKPDTTYTLSNGETYVSDSIGSANVSISLRNNETITVQNIPVGAKYKVYEHAGNYISSYVITDANNAGMINNTAKNNTKENKDLSTNTETADEGEDITITFTNKRIVTQNLKVQKVVTDPEDTNSYIFEIEFANLEEGTSFNSTVGKIDEEDGKAELTIYLAGGEEAEFYNVPVGTTYTVKELASSAIASYTVTDANGTNQIVSDSKANTTAKKALSTERETVNQGEEVTVTFINDTVNQEPDNVSASLGVTKNVIDKMGEKVDDCGETFTFELTTDNEENPMPEKTTVTIKGNGTASFGTITFNETGTYTYTVVEKAGDNEDCQYDNSTYTITYEVTNLEGLLEITKIVKKNGFESDVVEFTNIVEKEEPDVPVDPDKPVDPDEPVNPDEPTNPDEPSKPDDKKEEPENEDNGKVEPEKEETKPEENVKPIGPQTGDKVIMIMSIMVVAGIVLLITFKRRRK